MKNLIHVISIVIAIICGVSTLTAQTPHLINYQAVARNTTTGQELAQQSIFASIKILEDGPNGTIVYQENHDGLETNYLGLFNLLIGGGEPVTGSFNAIEWGTSQFWLAIEIDAGQGLQNIGTMQFVAVPYAFHAETASQIDDADADPTNELVQSIDFNPQTGVFSLMQEGGVLTRDLSALINDADADPTNELVQSIDFDSETNIFSLVQQGDTLSKDLSALAEDADSDPLNEAITNIQLVGTDLIVNEVDNWTVSLSQLVNDADADPTNELVQELQFNSATNVFSLVQEGGTLTQDLSALIDDADADPTNELVQELQFNSTTNVFSLVQEGGTLTQDLSPLIDDADADPTNELINSLALVNDTLLKIQEGDSDELTLNLAPLKQDQNWTKLNDGIVANIGSKVGIGTTTPASTFEVDGSVGYKVTVLESTSGAINYNVSPTDHILVCRLGTFSTNSITIFMPAAASCPGRSITIRKTGTVPIIAQVIISFGSDMYEFGDGTFSFGNYLRETVTFISLGSDGWTKL